MKSILTHIASLKLSLIGILGVIAVALLGNGSPDVGAGWVAIPLSFLSVNLLAAILSNGAFRTQTALLVFHVCLLAILLLIGIGVLIRFDGRVELVEGASFDPDTVQITQVGPWHRMGLDKVSLTQGEIEVAYLPGLIRRGTRSAMSVEAPDPSRRDVIVGDRASITINGYRFVTTFNKGFAVVILWTAANGNSWRGAINFPSYPEYEWKQRNHWTTPAGQGIDMELELASAARSDESWKLRSSDRPFAIEVSHDDIAPRVLHRGESVKLRGGVLKVEDLRLWMGYRIDFNPLFPWIFAAALVALIALAIHFQMKFWPARQPARQVVCGGVTAYDGCD